MQAKKSKSGREYFRLGAESYSSLGRIAKKEKKIARPLFCLWTSLESSPVSVNLYFSSGSDSGDSEGDDADGLKALLALGSTLNQQTYLFFIKLDNLL